MSPLQNFVVLPSLVPSAEQKLNQMEPGNEASGGLVLSPTPPRTHQHNLKEVLNRHNLSALFLLPSTFLPPLSLPPGPLSPRPCVRTSTTTCMSVEPQKWKSRALRRPLKCSTWVSAFPSLLTLHMSHSQSEYYTSHFSLNIRNSPC